MKEEEKAQLEAFFKMCHYVQGPYDHRSGFEKLNAELDKLGGSGVVNRLFYLALPPSVFTSASSNIKECCMTQK